MMIHDDMILLLPVKRPKLSYSDTTYELVFAFGCLPSNSFNENRGGNSYSNSELTSE